MINFDNREIINIIEHKKDAELTLCKNLYLKFIIDKKDGYMSIFLNYKDNIIHNVNFFYANDYSKNMELVFKDIHNAFQSFMLKLDNYIEHEDYHHIAQYLTIMIHKEMLIKSEELMVHSFNGITIISIQYKDKNREILLMYLDENDCIYFNSEILYTFENDKYNTYNPYDFMLRNMLFLGTSKFNILKAELTYLLN